jgi:hypothetical protein
VNKLSLFFLSTIIIFGGCNTAVNENSNTPLNGKWMLVNISGGIAGDIDDIDTKTEKHILLFDNNRSVSFFYNDSLLNTTNFQIEKRKFIYSTDELDFIIYENGSEPDAITYLSKDTLAIADNNYDGYTSVYIKQ